MTRFWKSAKTTGFVALAALAAACGGMDEARVTHVANDSVAHAALRVDAASTCDLGGTWLFDLAIPVKWDASDALRAGDGTVHLRAVSERKVAGTLVLDGLTLCAAELPTTTRQQGSTVQTVFSSATFQQGPATITPTLSTFRSHDVGARFRMQPFALQYGAVIPNPTMAPWPKDIDTYAIDMENDGHPGVTIGVTSPGHSSQRDPITQLFVALRVVLRTASGQLDSCTHQRGLGVVASLGDQLAVNVSVMGCAKRSGALCTAREHARAAAWVPTYLNNGNAKLQAMVVPEGSVCYAN